MTDILAQADRAFVEEDYEKAVQLYTEALKISPDSANIFESRAHAHIKLQHNLEAAEDASKAIELNPSLAKAYLRKGVACFNLEEYEAAKDAFEAGHRLAPENGQFVTWSRKCQAEIDDDQENSQPKRSAPSPADAKPLVSPATAPTPASTPAKPSQQQQQQQQQQPVSLTPAALASLHFEGKYRHQWYQLQNKVTVEIYAKNLRPDQVSVTFEAKRLSAAVVDADSGEEQYNLDVELYGKISPEQCKCEVLKSKVEITMLKADTTQWGSLEASTKVAAPNYSNVEQPPVAGKYPTSYAKNPRDWDKVSSELKEMEKKGELDDGDPLTGFFQKIFGQGDEDQRRAMIKSFTESNGTVLSTNWGDVGKKKVECTPPEGLVARKWGE